LCCRKISFIAIHNTSFRSCHELLPLEWILARILSPLQVFETCRRHPTRPIGKNDDSGSRQDPGALGQRHGLDPAYAAQPSFTSCTWPQCRTTHNDHRVKYVKSAFSLQLSKPTRCTQCHQAPHHGSCAHMAMCADCSGAHPVTAVDLYLVNIEIRIGVRAA